MKLYKRIALGALFFCINGPLMIAACFATLTEVIVSIHEYKGLGELVGSWLGIVALGSLVAVYSGGAPAAIVGALVGAMATRLRRRYLYLCAAASAIVVGLSFFAFVRYPGDGPLIFGVGFSIPVAVVLTKMLLAIIQRFDRRGLQGEQSPGKHL